MVFALMKISFQPTQWCQCTWGKLFGEDFIRTYTRFSNPNTLFWALWSLQVFPNSADSAWNGTQIQPYGVAAGHMWALQKVTVAFNNRRASLNVGKTILWQHVSAWMLDVLMFLIRSLIIKLPWTFLYKTLLLESAKAKELWWSIIKRTEEELCKICLILGNQIKEQISKWNTFGAC